MRTQVLLLGVIGPFICMYCQAGAIVSGFASTSDGRNDDGTFINGGCTNAINGGACAGQLVPIGFTANFFGLSFTGLYINTNGNVTFDAPQSTFTPFDLTSTNRQIIAPFFADVDTRNAASGVTTFGTGTFGGRNAFGVNWINVGYFGSQADKTNSFQLILVDRSDTGAGNFDIVFNYDRISWETGSASNGTNGFGGSSARAGFSNGTRVAGTFFELPGSAVNGAFLDGTSAQSLVTHDLNSGVSGRYVFFARNGTVIQPPDNQTPEPSTLLTMGTCLLVAAASRKRASRAHARRSRGLERS